MASFSISKKLKTQKRPVFSSPDKKDESFFNEREEEASQEQRKKSGLHANPLNEKANPFNQISLAMPQRFNLSRCQLKKHQICKDLEPSNNATHHIVDQVLGIHFQEEIIMEILIRLPVRSLLRFKCVSKGWKALISDPYFKMKHLNHAKNDHDSQKFLVYRAHANWSDIHCSSLSSDQLVEDEQKLDIPMNMKCGFFTIIGCCDGLVLLKLIGRFIGLYRKIHLWLWNPSTRESIELPAPKYPEENLLYGIGYDMVSDDYKILAIDVIPRGQMQHDEKVSSQVLALKSGSWRDSKYPYPTGICRVFGFLDGGMGSLAFVHGAFHWVGMSLEYTIVSFNISNEVYGEIPLLEGMCFKVKIYSRREITVRKITEHGVSEMGGMLYFYATNYYEGEGSFKLWVMKEYGVKESWTILFTIHDTNLFYSARPRYRYADGEVLLRCVQLKGGLAYVYRTSKGPFGLWPLDNITRREVVYTESLISPKSITCYGCSSSNELLEFQS